MAYRDYILCKTCQCKIVYDGGFRGRERLETYWGEPESDEWTVGLLCPDCIRQLEAEVKRLTGLVYDATCAQEREGEGE